MRTLQKTESKYICGQLLHMFFRPPSDEVKRRWPIVLHRLEEIMIFEKKMLCQYAF